MGTIITDIIASIQIDSFMATISTIGFIVLFLMLAYNDKKD
ncbi:hypothetical protein [Enterococcus phage VPE25]|nr:hypothetical protein [Enterococcus phage VPE25]